MSTINSNGVAESFKEFELQIDPLFEPIGLPKHGAFVAHGLRIISGKFGEQMRRFGCISKFAGNGGGTVGRGFEPLVGCLPVLL